ncbi:hypothetical protein P153DRAFT_399448 [Dothidotthia symphoricarpi CBS 119687]|uniref:Rhodopsin domain-containing protein n=1 Tax=Dothidotthia symphoricarpi CBS 119687 TaxID=1392245 RepID=A0A6A6A297_9PLEO|nr:uncharacterized protein P153DRAFT_399448 [Dothidotthia symphoricarpi CBS 119687]KAF2125969.1 hypothetical protein P153DRAFT_399448 [Dothidotthia symphoricarpi CBS 119687]
MAVFTLNDVPPEVLKLLETTPVSPPPDGTTSNFVNPTTRAALQNWTTSVIGAAMLVFYMNRVYIKARLMKSWTWDDVTLFISVLLSIAQYVILVISIADGPLGRHLWDVSIVQALSPTAAKTSYAIFVISPWNSTFIKATFFILYIHLFARIRWIRICSWAGLVFAVSTHAGIAIYGLVIANPRESETWATRAFHLAISLSVFGIISDAMIFVIPFAVIIPLQLSITKKIGAIVIFLTGGSAVICSALNLYYRVKLSRSPDPTWDSVPGSLLA